MNAEVRRWVVPFGVMGAITAVLMTAMAFGSNSESEDGLDDVVLQRVDAERYCQDEVRARLKAPSTAEFGAAQVEGFGPFTVSGAVDAQNSVGAALRAQYACTVRLDGTAWVLEDITLD